MQLHERARARARTHARRENADGSSEARRQQARARLHRVTPHKSGSRNAVLGTFVFARRARAPDRLPLLAVFALVVGGRVVDCCRAAAAS